jgi:hypothetical protein
MKNKNPFKIGTRIRPSDERIESYRTHLLQYYGIGDTITQESRAKPCLLMWAMADLETPKGEVIAGNPAFPDIDVRVRLSSKYGSDECYIEKSSLVRYKTKKRR